MMSDLKTGDIVRLNRKFDQLKRFTELHSPDLAEIASIDPESKTVALKRWWGGIGLIPPETVDLVTDGNLIACYHIQEAAEIVRNYAYNNIYHHHKENAAGQLELIQMLEAAIAAWKVEQNS